MENYNYYSNEANFISPTLYRNYSNINLLQNNNNYNLCYNLKNFDNLKNSNYVEDININNKITNNDREKLIKEIVIRDREIEGYKEKVKALLAQIKEKNYNLIKKDSTILNLCEGKEENSNNNLSEILNGYSNNNIENMKNLLKFYSDSLEKYKNEVSNLKIKNQKLKQNINKLIQKENKISKQSYDYNLLVKDINNYSINSFYLTFEKEQFLYKSFDKKYCKREGESSNSINFEDKNEKLNDNISDKLILQKSLEIEKYKKIIEELKKKNIDNNHYKQQIEGNNNSEKYYNEIYQDKEKALIELSKKNESLENNLNIKINGIKELKLKNEDEVLLNDLNNNSKTINQNNIRQIEEELRDNKIQITLKNRENEDLKKQINIINDQKLNKEKEIEELNEDIESYKEENENIKKEIKENINKIEILEKNKNELEIKIKEMKNINEENNIIKNKYEELKKENDKLNNENNELKNNINKLKEVCIKLKDKNEQLIIDKTELVQKMMEINNKNIGENININTNKEIEEINPQINNDMKKENEMLQNKIDQLNEINIDLNNQLNSLNIKYQAQKKDIKQKDLEINDLKEVSYSLINKQKNELEKKDKNNKNNNISPETHFILSQKKYNDLIWYLVSNMNPNEKKIPNNYDYFTWVNGDVITERMFSKFNKFEDEDEIKINDLYSYIKKLQDKLEQKEEEINKKDYINKRLNSRLENRTENMKIGSGILSNLNKSNSNHNKGNLINNINSANEDYVGKVKKYQNLIDKLNDFDLLDGDKNKKKGIKSNEKDFFDLGLLNKDI